jgi:cell division protein FtsI (penicillin-binding protein 3)
MRVVEVGLLALLGLLALRAGHLSVVDRRGLERGREQTGRELQLASHRGLIVDRNGAELAVSLASPSVYAIPASVKDLRATAKRLAAALGQPEATVRGRLDRTSSFVFVARWVSPEKAEKVSALALPGIGVIEEPRRVYPHGDLAAQIVGFANIDGRGVRGIEQQEEDWLSGTPLEVSVERDNRGQLLLPPGIDLGASSGGDVALTLDTVLQADAERALDAAVRKYDARGGLVVTLAPRTGEVLALAERPGFDSNRFREVRYSATRSRAFLDALEPGSTLKAFLVAAALEEGVIRPDQQIDCGDGELRIPGKRIRDRRAFGLLDPGGILRVSSNIGAALIAFDLGAERHFEALRRFGFGATSGSGFPEESAGLLRPAARWRKVDHATIAYGQGISVTAIQLAAATAALANDGVWQSPRLVAARRSRGQSWQPNASGPSHRVVSAATAQTVLEMMRGVVSAHGTGNRASLRDVPVAGKTGTAQKLVGGRYDLDRYLAWFVGVVPADDPELAIVVMLDEPAGDHHTGGSAAAPLFAEVASSQLRRLGIVTEPQLQTVKVAARQQPSAPARGPSQAAAPAPPKAAPPKTAPPKKVAARKKAATPAAETPHTAPAPPLVARGNRVLVPDFLGLTPEEVKGITSGSGLEIELLGEGRAIAQEPDPGTILASSSRIRVRFSRAGG